MTMLAHNVFFGLRDNSQQAKDKLIEACHKYLSTHPGIVLFGCGVLADALRRDVNDRDFDVALHIVFENEMAHDGYQAAPLHERFINENKANWKKVRVFDSLVDMISSTASERGEA
jgi:Stress responsive A/B Barrel Domain